MSGPIQTGFPVRTTYLYRYYTSCQFGLLDVTRLHSAAPWSHVFPAGVYSSGKKFLTTGGHQVCEPCRIDKVCHDCLSYSHSTLQIQYSTLQYSCTSTITTTCQYITGDGMYCHLYNTVQQMELLTDIITNNSLNFRFDCTLLCTVQTRTTQY